jgi:hypothetical protein
MGSDESGSELTWSSGGARAGGSLGDPPWVTESPSSLLGLSYHSSKRFVHRSENGVELPMRRPYGPN